MTELDEIRARHEAGERASAVDDREWLLAEVERLREVIRTIRARCVEMDDSDAVSETLDIASAALEGKP